MSVPFQLRPTLEEIRAAYELGPQEIEQITAMSGVPRSIVAAMFVGSPVERKYVAPVLAALSVLTNCKWTIETTCIAVM